MIPIDIKNKLIRVILVYRLMNQLIAVRQLANPLLDFFYPQISQFEVRAS